MYHFRVVLMAIAFISSAMVAQSQPKANASKSIKLLFVGDIMGHGPQVKSAYDATTKTYNYNPCFKYVKPIIEDADLAIGNLEVTLPGKPPYRGYPMFRSPDALGDAVKNAGFDVIVTSNNHSNDGRLEGITHTIDVLRNLNIHQTGTFKNEKERQALYPLIVYKNGFKLAFLNYTYDTNGLPTPPPAVVNLIDEDLIKNDIDAAKAMKPDAIIVVMHWGLEYQLNESPVQQQLAKDIFKWGADLVIGAHPHVVQPIKESYEPQADGSLKKQVTVYSMGNFISNQQKKNTDGGIMFEIELRKDEKNQLTLGDHAFIPIWRYIERKGGKTTYYALPISAVENAEYNPLKLSATDRKKMDSFAKTTRLHLSKFDSKERKITWGAIQQKEKTSEVGTNNSRVQRGYLPFNYVVGRKLGSSQNQLKGSSARVVEYYLSMPVHRIQPANTKMEQIASPDTTKPKFQKVRTYNPKVSSEKGGSAIKSGEVKGQQQPRALFKPKKNPVPEEKPKPYSYPSPSPSLQQNPTDTTLSQYMIQFQASRNLYPKSKYSYLGEIEIEATENGWYRYYTGSANSVETAKVLLTRVKAAGFNDAFITKKKRIKDINEEFTAKGDEAANPDAPKSVYKIQFQSAKNYYNISPKLFTDVLVLEHDGWFRYYTGSASTIADANKFLEYVQGKGFKDAFIVTFVNGKPK